MSGAPHSRSANSRSPAPPVSRTRSPFTTNSTSTPPRLRTKSSPKPSTHSSPSKLKNDPVPQMPALSIREAIALRRAEAKKSAAKGAAGGLGSSGSMEDALPVIGGKNENDDVVDLVRWSVRETIERARSTGSLNISARSLICLPSALFELHLRIKPEPLKLVPNEPPLPDSDTPIAARRAARQDKPSWFEAQDLHVLKAWSNDIVEIQPEISLFGSLKTVDLHKNQLTFLPDTFADLTVLTTLDVSHNALTSLPSNIFALPNLAILNISHNKLSSLPFKEPFASAGSQSRSNFATGSFFVSAIARASTPLPRLVTLDASHNELSASTIDHNDDSLPVSLSKVDLSANPLGVGNPHCRSLLQALSGLQKIKELRFEQADIGDDAFPADLLTSSLAAPFPSLHLLHLGETKVTLDAAKAALKGLKQDLSFDVTTEDPPAGVVRVIVGKKIVKEAWEIEAEGRTKARIAKFGGTANILDSPVAQGTSGVRKGSEEVAKEPWEIEAEQGLLTEGARRRARAAAAAAATVESQPTVAVESQPTVAVAAASPPAKEPWEIEAEQGLLTEGGRRRARAAAAAAAAKNEAVPSSANGAPSSTPVKSSSSSSFSLTNPQYYSQHTQTLTLPPSMAPSKAPGHSRAFSLAASSSSAWSSTPPGTTDIALPTPTLPLAVIVTQSFAQTLRVLVLANRRLDRSISLPPFPDGADTVGALLPNLEELSLEGCGLNDSISVSRQSSGSATPPRSNEGLLALLARLFPSLKSLDLSYNALTSSSLKADVLSELILATTNSLNDSHQPLRSGLKHLRLRGNRLTELEGLQTIAMLFKGHREVPAWKLDEIDLRDNEIGKLPPELGLLPLDVFLVDGNVFRVPQRRVWEREGTKGLLSWLRGRIE